MHILNPIEIIKPNEDVRNLFEKKTYGIQEEDVDEKDPVRVASVRPHPQRKPLFEYEGRLDDIDPKKHA